MPESVCDVVSLVSLHLNNNKIKTITDSISKLTNLQVRNLTAF